MSRSNEKNAQVPLFRQQAVVAKTNRLEGEPSLASPPGIRLLGLVAAASALALIAVLVFGSYSRKETVSGYVTTTEANIRVYPPVSGTISALFVAEGDSVVKGDALARLSTSRVSDGHHSVQGKLLDSMHQEAAMLGERILNAVEIGKNKGAALHRQIENLLYQIGVMKGQRENALEQLALAQKNNRRLAQIRKAGLVSEVDLDNSRARYLDLKVALNRLDRDLATQRNVLVRLRLEKQQLPAVNAINIGELEAKLQQLEQRITDVQAQNAIMIVAPIDGRVSVLGRRVGQRVSVDTPVVSVLPIDASWSAELYVPSRSIGFARQGSEVQLRYDAFPHQKYGIYSGTVVNVGTTPVRPHEADTIIRITEPSYLLTVHLQDQDVVADGKRRPLTAGMTLQADIVQDRRHIIEWLFDPLLSAVKRTQ